MTRPAVAAIGLGMAEASLDFTRDELAKAGTAVRRITQGCIEILGPMGISREHLLEKWFRDVRITDIYEGTGEIQRMITARALLGYGREELS
jgi:acyl-CoA dehydrogenase